MAHSGRRMDFLGACVTWALGYPEAIIYAGIEGSAAHTAVGRWCSTMHQIVGGRMAEPVAVAIVGKRGGVDVVVEVDGALLNMAKRTKMRAAGRPQKRWLWGAVGGKNDARCAC